MTRACTFAVILGVGVLAAFEAPLGFATDPILPTPPTATITVTRTVPARYHGRTAKAWARAEAQQRANSEARGKSLRRLKRAARVTWQPTVEYALQLASRVYGIPYSKMRAVAYCESTLSPGAVNGRYKGIFQLGWAPFGFSPFDPVASALSAAQTVVHDGSWRQWSCGGA